MYVDYRLVDQGRHPIYISPYLQRVRHSRRSGPSLHRIMPPRPSSRSSRQLSRLDPLRVDEEISAPSTSRRALSDVTDPAKLEPLRSPDPSIHIGVDHPGWERLIRSPLATNERISLISTILTNRDEIEMARHLNSGDAQTFIDVIHGVRSFFHLQRIDLLLTLTRTSAVFRSDVG